MSEATTLYWSSRSPFARFVMVAAHELGLADRLALERVVVSARGTNPEVMAHNPLNKIPTLLPGDGAALFDSRVIVEYLDTCFGEGRLLPADPARRWPVLRLQALGTGLMELNVARLGEANRGALSSAEHAAAFRAKTVATLDLLEREALALQPLSAGSIAMAVALAHLDFRFAEDRWRDGRAALAEWFTRFNARPSMQATQPENVY
jgi:glutathione S-transferase